MTSMDLVVRQFSDLVTWGRAGVFLLRLTAVAGGGALGLLLLSRASAALRHRVAVVTLATALALPVAFLALPPLRVTLPVTLPAPRPVAVAAPETAAPTPYPGVIVALRTPATDAPALRVARSAVGTVRATGRSAARQLPRLPGLPRGAAAASLLAGLVAAGLLLREARAEWAARRLVARAVPVTDATLRAEFEAARARLGLSRSVALRHSADLGVPVVCGAWRHTLLLPEGAAAWPAARREAVLLHELAHVQRRDGLWLAVTRVAGALFWFHPLVRGLARQARLACEQACDDVVLSHGLRGSAYAEDLLVLAREARGLSGLSGVAPAFAQLSTLESRLTAILAPRARRDGASRRATLAVGLAALAALALAGTVRVGAAPRAHAAAERCAAATPTGTPVEVACHDKKAQCTEKAAATVEEAEAGGEEAAPEKVECSNTPAEQAFDQGMNRYEAKDYPASAEAYLRAAAGGYRRDTALYNAACSLALAGDTARGLATLQQALDAGFDQVELLSSDDDLASLRAEADFARLVRRGQALPAARDRRTAALAEYTALRDRADAAPEEWGVLGVRLMRLGEYPVAVDAFQRQFAADSSAAPLYNEACAWALAGKTLFALGALERSILSGFEDADQMASDSDLASLHGDPRFARLVALTRRLEMHGSWPASENPGQWRALSAEAQALVREHPEIGRAWFNLGYTKLALGDTAGTVDAFQRALARGYRTAHTAYNLACANARAGRNGEAVDWLGRAEAAGFRIADQAPWDPDLKSLRDDPRFRELATHWTHQRNAAWTQKLNQKTLEKRLEKQLERRSETLVRQLLEGQN